MTGSLINATSSVVLTMSITRLFGEGYLSDVFSLAYATAFMLSTIGLFEVRPFQATDVRSEFCFKDYLLMRYFTCTLMMLVCLIFIAINKYDLYKSLIVVLLCIYMMTGALQDVYHGFFQLKGRLDLAGISLSIRILSSVVAFFTTLIITKKLGISCVVLCLVSFLSVITIDLFIKKNLHSYPKNNYKFSMLKQKKLFVFCFPLFCCSFLVNYITNASKYSIDNIYHSNNGLLTIYSVLIMPAASINLLSLFAFRPTMTPIAESFANKNMSRLKHYLKRLMLWIISSTAICTILAYYIGIPVLEMLYKIPLKTYRWVLVIIMLGGAINAIVNVLLYIVTVLRKQYISLWGYALCSVIAFLSAYPLVNRLELLGAALNYLFSFLSLLVYFYLILLHQYKKIKQQ